MADEPKNLSFSLIREQLDELLEATINKLEREWPEKWASEQAAQLVLRAMVLVARNTYKTMRFICADTPENAARKSEYAISVPPLTRTILDSIFTVVYLFKDLPAHAEWFHKSGWREAYEELQRFQDRYGSDPQWKEWLTTLAGHVEQGKSLWGITAEEESDMKKQIKWWPTPGRMASDKELPQDRRDFLTYLNDWYYRELSAAAHLSLPGLMKRASYFLADAGEQAEQTLKKYRSDCVLTTITLLVALLSEIEVELQFGLGERLKSLWTVLGAYWGDADELWSQRYESLL